MESSELYSHNIHTEFISYHLKYRFLKRNWSIRSMISMFCGELSSVNVLIVMYLDPFRTHYKERDEKL